MTHADLLKQLNEVYKECSVAGWDGENAEPVSIETLLRAMNFLALIKLLHEMPSIGAESDGCITFDWHKRYHSNGRYLKNTISLSIDKNGTISWASINNEIKRTGEIHVR